MGGAQHRDHGWPWQCYYSRMVSAITSLVGQLGAKAAIRCGILGWLDRLTCHVCLRRWILRFIGTYPSPSPLAHMLISDLHMLASVCVCIRVGVCVGELMSIHGVICCAWSALLRKFPSLKRRLSLWRIIGSLGHGGLVCRPSDAAAGGTGASLRPGSCPSAPSSCSCPSAPSNCSSCSCRHRPSASEPYSEPLITHCR